MPHSFLDARSVPLLREPAITWLFMGLEALSSKRLLNGVQLSVRLLNAVENLAMALTLLHAQRAGIVDRCLCLWKSRLGGLVTLLTVAAENLTGCNADFHILFGISLLEADLVSLQKCLLLFDTVLILGFDLNVVGV